MPVSNAYGNNAWPPCAGRAGAASAGNVVRIMPGKTMLGMLVVMLDLILSLPSPTPTTPLLKLR